MSIVRLLPFLGCTVVLACVPTQPPRTRMVEAPQLSCEQANRLAYRAVTTLGYAIPSFQVATRGQPGHIVAEPHKAGQKGGRVTITCGQDGATVVAERTGPPIPSLVGAAERPRDFQNVFTRSFNILRSSQEILDQQGPGEGLSMTLSRVNSFESQIELGADLPAQGILPVKVVIHNNTPRPYGLKASEVFLVSTGGGRVAPIAAPAAGQGRVLDDRTLQPGQTVTGFLFYPAGEYTSANTILIDKENDEREGFSVQF